MSFEHKPGTFTLFKEAIKACRDVPGCHTERKQRVEIK